jgi:hypothetical protein
MSCPQRRRCVSLRRLTRAARHQAAPWPGLRLPRLWAGFRFGDTHGLRGDGPEFEQACLRQELTTAAVFSGAMRYFDGLTLYPLEWVSGQLLRTTAVFAEVTPSLRRQTCRIEGMPDGLIGYQGASAFDFYNSRYRNARRDDTTYSYGEKHKLLIPQTDRDAAQLMQTVSCVA